MLYSQMAYIVNADAPKMTRASRSIGMNLRG